MPELPEVETVRQGLNLLTLGQEIMGGEVLLARSIAYPNSAVDFLASLQGVAIAQWHRRGKYLLAELVNSQKKPTGWLGVHLRMTGQLLWLHQQDPLQKHTRVRLFFTEERELRFVDQRTFGQMWWVPPKTNPETIMTGLKRLGPEPFSADFSVEYLASQMRGRRRPVKTALLDQAIVAGIGNIYADEALFLSGVLPTKLCTQMSPHQVEQLHTSIIQVLQNSINVGGTTFSNFLNVHGVNGNYGGIAWVYNRVGESCRVCGTVVQRLKLGGRSTYFCPQCQTE